MSACTTAGITAHTAAAIASFVDLGIKNPPPGCTCLPHSRMITNRRRVFQLRRYFSEGAKNERRHRFNRIPADLSRNLRRMEQPPPDRRTVYKAGKRSNFGIRAKMLGFCERDVCASHYPNRIADLSPLPAAPTPQTARVVQREK